MASATDKISEVLARYDVPYEGNVWAVQGTPVIKHMALEAVAAKAQIAFDKPTVLRAERDEAVILVSGCLYGANSENGTQHAWSIGEALIGVNYRVSGKQAAYVYAMAEKRAKDRVILKLVSLHGLAYSEEEADDFKQQHSTPAAPRADLRNVRDLHSHGAPIQRNRSQEISSEMLTALWKISGPKVDRWLNLDAVKRDLEALDEVDRDRVVSLAEERAVIEAGPMEAAQ
jgi:hypothetical protein